jgi:RNA polymerase sigma-70 factor, ECF subfamily
LWQRAVRASTEWAQRSPFLKHAANPSHYPQRFVPSRPSSELLTSSGEAQLVRSLQAGDEAAFAELVERYHPSLVRLALSYVREHSVAEEVAQETWLAVLQGIGRFEQRSSFHTWLFKILTNRAKTRGQREARSVPMSSLGPADEADEPSVDPDRFRPPGAPKWPGGWADPPRSWGESPEQRLLASETRGLILEVIGRLPATQRAVITLRDIEGLPAEEVCNVLELTDTNQRVLLHRARSKVRQALEDYMA